jgi:hypothetical protein
MALFSIPTNVVAVIIIPFLLSVSWSSVAATTPTIITRSHRDSRLPRQRHDNNNFRYTSKEDKSNQNRNRKRNLVRGEAWVQQQQKGLETDNIFVHNHNDAVTKDECACDRRRRRQLGVGHSSSCICDNDNDNDTEKPSVAGSGESYYSYYVSKGAKSGSYYGKGASSGSSSDGESYYGDYYGKASKGGKGKGASYYYYQYTKQQKDEKKGKQEKSKGYGKGNSYDDDYVYPTSLPTKVPTFPPPPTLAPAGPTPSLSPHLGREDTNTPTLKPTSRPTAPKQQPACSVSPNGLYGQKLGVSSEFRFLYQTQVIPSVTVPELNLDMVPKVELQMGNDLLPKLFPAECSSSTLGAVATRSSLGGNGNTRKTTVVDNDEDGWDGPKQGGAFIFGNANRGRTRRQLQSLLPLNGMSIKPRDTVDENGKQTKPNLSESDRIGSVPMQRRERTNWKITFFLTHKCFVSCNFLLWYCFGVYSQMRRRRDRRVSVLCRRGHLDHLFREKSG